MKTLKKVTILFLFISLNFACSSENNSSNCETCVYTIASGETAGTVPSTLEGVHNLTLSSAQSGYAFTDGTKATFTISNNEMTVEIEGEACITLKNPIVSSNQVEYTFKDTCRDNVSYSASGSSNGGINEINVISTSGAFYGQFN